ITTFYSRSSSTLIHSVTLPLLHDHFSFTLGYITTFYSLVLPPSFTLLHFLYHSLLLLHYHFSTSFTFLPVTLIFHSFTVSTTSPPHLLCSSSVTLLFHSHSLSLPLFHFIYCSSSVTLLFHS